MGDLECQIVDLPAEDGSGQDVNEAEQQPDGDARQSGRTARNNSWITPREYNSSQAAATNTKTAVVTDSHRSRSHPNTSRARF